MLVSFFSQLSRVVCVLCLAVASSLWGQSALNVPNAGFEDPVIGDGNFTATVANWSSFDGVEIGVLNPSTADYPGEAEEGQNVGYVFGATQETGMEQELNAVFQEGGNYSLSVKVGNPGGVSGFPGYVVRLMVADTVLVEEISEDDEFTTSITSGTFRAVSLDYDWNSGDIDLVGEPLKIQLFSRGLAQNSEVDFDEVQLLASLQDPLAAPGGPYSVPILDSLALDGSGSIPSQGHTITSYEWDIDDDGVFGDVTGATPTPIPALDLLSDWGLSGENDRITLRVVDSSGKESEISTTVTLVVPPVTPGADFLVDASRDDDGDNRWEDLVEGNPTGSELLIDAGAGVSRVALAEQIGTLTHAYSFPGGQTGNSGGAEFVATGSTSNTGAEQWGWDRDDVTMEFFFKPANLNPTPSNGQILFETGGGTGLGVFIDDGQIVVSHDSNEVAASYNLSTDPDGVLTGVETGGFIHAVATHSTTSPFTTQLFINGVFVASGSDGDSDWSGGDPGAIGTRGGSNTGGRGGGQSNTESFAGEVAFIRFYHNQILTEQEANNNFINSLSGDVSSPVLVSTNPATGETAASSQQLDAVFDEDVVANAGDLRIVNLTDSVTTTIPVTDTNQVSFSGRTMTIIPTSVMLEAGKSYAVEIDEGAVKNISDLLFLGIDDQFTWTFTMETTAPSLVSTSPENGTNTSIASALFATFDEPVAVGSGVITLTNLTDGVVMEIDVTDSSQISISGDTLSIAPDPIMVSDKSYSVRIAPTAITDLVGNPYAGIEDDVTWTFTALSTSVLFADDFESPDVTGYAQGTTPPGWVRHSSGFRSHQHGLIDKDSGDFFAADPNHQAYAFRYTSSPGITTAEGAVGKLLTGVTYTVKVDVQQDLGTGGDWYDISFMAFDEGAVRNAGPGSTGQNVLTSAKAQVANDGQFHTITLTFTADEVAHANHLGKDIGVLMSDVWSRAGANGGIVDNVEISFESAIADPTLVSIDDDQAGGPVEVGSPVTYAVRFDQAMNAATIGVDDFEQASTAGVTIDSVSATTNPGVFDVVVTPTTTGNLVLQIKSGTVIESSEGLALDTSTALADDTTIEVIEVQSTPFESWTDNFPLLSDPDPALDFDNGGYETALEWVLGGDPTDPVDDTSLAPTIDATTDPDGKLLFVFRRASAADQDANTSIVVEYGGDLTGWTAAAHQGTGPDQITITEVTDGFEAGVDRVTVALPPSLSAAGKLFVRLNVGVVP